MYFLADEAKEIPIYIAIPLGIVLIIALFCLFFIVSRQSKNNYNK